MLAALVSGGKDSLYALYLAGKENIRYIITFASDNPESYMFHIPNIHLVEEQAKLMGIKIIKKPTKGIKEKELDDIKSALKAVSGEIDGVVTGAIESNYQKQRIDKICKELDLKSIAPLWHQDPEKLLRSMIRNGFEIIITGVAAPPLNEGWLGRKIDEACLKELVQLNKKYKIHICFEGGEGETFVKFCPMFNKRIEILDSIKHWDVKTKSGTLEIKKIRRIDK